MSANNNLVGDRIKDTASSVSSTTVTLSNSAPTGFQTFGAFYANADICPSYLIYDTAGNWEVSSGAYTSSGTTLGRAGTPRASSNAGAQVASFSGTITVACVDDAAFTNAPAPGLQSGQLWPAFNMTTATASGAKSTGVVRYSPVFIGQWFTTVNLHISINAVFAGTSTMAIGLYSNLNGC